MKDRSNQELRHDPDKLCHACNQAAIEFEHGSGLDMLKLICFNEPYLACTLTAIVFKLQQADT